MPILTTRPAGHTWEILCPPGALAQFLASLAQQPNTIHEQINGHQVEIITLTPDLDLAITQLIDTLTDIRYETGRVQLELFNMRHIL